MKAFGTIPWVLKLPFLITGLFCIYFIWLIGKKWFDIKSSDNKDILLVGTLESNQNAIHWGSKSYKEYKKNDNEWTTVYYSIKLADADLQHKNMHFKTYIWNNQKANFQIDNFVIKVRTGYPYLYGLVEKLMPEL